MLDETASLTEKVDSVVFSSFLSVYLNQINSGYLADR